MAHYRTPVAFVSGDRVTAEEAAPFAPDAVSVLTKESITRAAALNLHPDESCRLIRAGAEEAVRRVAAGKRAAARDRLPGGAGHGVPDR